ncbi:MAG: sulfotransferase family protein [Rhodospirillales bacterium]
MSDFTKPIFIACAPRSGSTLLRLVLDAHPRLAVPSPCWMYELNYPYLYSYGDLSNKDNFRALAQDVHDNKFVQNLQMGLDVVGLMEAATEQSFKGIYEGIHIHYAKSKGKTRWGEKSPRDAFWVDDIIRDFPDAQIVHIVRDGRDMAIDIADSPEMLPNNIYTGAHIWREFNTAVINSAKSLNKDNYYVIRYEDICADPEPTLKKLCDFLGEDYDPAMLAHHTTESTKGWSKKANHVKTGRPINTDYCEMYKNRLPQNDIEALDAFIGDLLNKYNYPVSPSPSAIPDKLAAQLMESETVSAVWIIDYRRSLADGRRERIDQGVYKLEDRESLLWSLY